jgi:GntR family transcriptional regulator, transcriptional repressor for pyruvate dehydrogenase complex
MSDQQQLPSDARPLWRADPADAVAVPASLADRVAAMLREQIVADGLPPGTRLPAEQALARRFRVSRTVLRQSIALLKNEGLLESRRGSGTFLRAPAEVAPSLVESFTAASIQSLLNLIETRCGVEGEIAALAAVRRTPGQLAEIEHALRAITAAEAAGRDGVAEDSHFHQCIAAATGNPYWGRFFDFFTETFRTGLRVTRANEARREDFVRSVCAEHNAIVAAIAAQDAERARASARAHMEQAAVRIRAADREFWQGEGGALARRLTGG